MKIDPKQIRMEPVPRSEWAKGIATPGRHPAYDPNRREVWLGCGFLAQVFHNVRQIDGNDSVDVRISINRTEWRNGRWVGDITWDELMGVKRAIGRGSQWCTEVYPPDDEVVDVANMRHLWLLSEAPSYAWRKR